MRRLASVVVLVLAVAAGSASATHQDPEERLTRADNARAQAMLIRASDLPAGFVAQKDTSEDPHFACPGAVGESDLTLTGRAEGKQFALAPLFVASAAQIYESRADADASWRRGSSVAGVRCATTLLRREFAADGIRLASFRRFSFPRLGERTLAFRATLSAPTPQGPLPLFVDAIVLMQGRAHATVIVGSGLVAPPRDVQLRFARLVEGRMTKALRGA